MGVINPQKYLGHLFATLVQFFDKNPSNEYHMEVWKFQTLLIFPFQHKFFTTEFVKKNLGLWKEERTTTVSCFVPKTLPLKESKLLVG